MKTLSRTLIYLFLGVCFTGCGAYLNQPMKTSRARIGEETPVNGQLQNLPKPKTPVVVSVYKFRDQTGQYKPSDFGSSWSTAVTQGGTNILVKALMDSGWFTVIERENVGNLLNERKIIRQTRSQYKREDESQPLITPLLFSSLIIEGGIVSYDANIVTGGAGVRYFGAGGSGQYRQDRVTVFLRAVSTKTGKVVKNVYTSKTILSQSVDAGLFRFVKFSRLLEIETGFTFNEPADMAVMEAIDMAVYSLIMEGMQEGLWPPVGEAEAARMNAMLAGYQEEREKMDQVDLLGRDYRNYDHVGAASLSGTGLIYQGDFPNPQMNVGVEVGVNVVINPTFSFRFGTGQGKLVSENLFEQRITYFDGNIQMRFLPRDRLSPFVMAGGGMLLTNTQGPNVDLGSNAIFKLNVGFGMEFYANNWLGLELAFDNNYLLNDQLDGVTAGKYNDYFYRTRFGLKFYLNRNSKEKNESPPY